MRIKTFLKFGTRTITESKGIFQVGTKTGFSDSEL